MENKKNIIVTGSVEFYGYVDNYDESGKEYVLNIKNPVFKNLDWDLINSWYEDSKGKVKLPKMYEALAAGNTPENVFFRSQYPVTHVTLYNKEDKTLSQVEVKNPQLKDMTIVMKVKKSYIGAIMVDKVPDEFTPTAFTAEDLDEELPF